MKNKLYIFGLTLILSAVIASGCVAPKDQPTEIPTDAQMGEGVEAPETVRDVLDAVLAYLTANYGEEASAPGLTWTGGSILPENPPPGWAEYRFTAEDWVITIGHAVLPPERTVYQVVVANETIGFEWKGEVDAAGQVVERPTPEEVRAVRDAAMAYVGEQYSEQVPAPGLTWREMDLTREGQGWTSSVKYDFISAGWAVTVYCPVLLPEARVYTVVVINQTTGLQWQGEVDAAGEVTETLAPAAGQSVVAWFGYVVSTTDGAQFDDYVVLQPGEVGQFGIEGFDEVVETQIVALRDHVEPGKYAHFWGTLHCDVIDYGGCQLLVDRVRSGIEITAPEPIVGWEGKIYSNEPGAQFDQYFVLDGDYPVWYGITSYIEENGWPIYIEELENLRDTRQTIRVWGQMVCGVPDVNGCQIQVNRLEVDGVEVDAYESWTTYTNEENGFSFRYPTTWEIVIEEGAPFISLKHGNVVFIVGFCAAQKTRTSSSTERKALSLRGT